MLNTYNTARKKNSLTKFETLVFGMAAVLTLTAIVTSFVNSAYFEMIFNRDGGFIGYLTVLLLLIIFGISAVYIIRLSRYRSIQFCIVLILTGIFSLFFAAQIMSDLPNLFHVSTHKLLKVNSTILRANAGSIVKINAIGKVAFYWLFIAAGAFYFLILPFVYRSNFKAKRFIDKIGIPIPHRTHIIALVVLAILMVLFTEVSESEVLQLNLSAIFMLILLYPENIGVFRR
ncbi:hypothetical protein MTO98_19700 [Mucilaginibacter sp. SMC90]|uniref:hypothetical protein n=1 Tax=Mucilaginibacter sp. SMC90 TaxID=2929803 RepID=UPI001FB40960|nr:hypothetical protein [Mucilaginibacter sp. SMC90]UOE46632.1 hypothetical protein MTO98_19700 [Mucilaginibacter sp. SMC90]